MLDLQLTNRRALVLGGGGGLGGAVSQALAREGAKVAIADINEGAAEASAARVRATGGAALAIQWDISDLGVIGDRLGMIERELGPVDILVNITGGPPPTPAAGQDPSLWQGSFQSMVMSVVAITDHVLPGMRARRWGRIVTSASSGIVMPIPNLGVSNALRLSLIGWSKTLAGEVAGDGVTCNVIIPGRIDTERVRFLDQSRAEREGRPAVEVSAESMATIPLRRYGKPEEYADVVAFLASDRASYVTGSSIRVDGGLIPVV